MHGTAAILFPALTLVASGSFTAPPPPPPTATGGAIITMPAPYLEATARFAPRRTGDAVGELAGISVTASGAFNEPFLGLGAALPRLLFNVQAEGHKEFIGRGVATGALWVSVAATGTRVFIGHGVASGALWVSVAATGSALPGFLGFAHPDIPAPSGAATGHMIDVVRGQAFVDVPPVEVAASGSFNQPVPAISWTVATREQVGTAAGGVCADPYIYRVGFGIAPLVAGYTVEINDGHEAINPPPLSPWLTGLALTDSPQNHIITGLYRDLTGQSYFYQAEVRIRRTSDNAIVSTAKTEVMGPEPAKPCLE